MPDGSYISGSGAGLLGNAQILPENSMQQINLGLHLQRLQQDAADKADEEKKQKEAKRYALNQFYGKQFDPSNYDTETEYNNVINPQLAQAHKEISDLIYHNAAPQDIDAAVQQKLSPILKTYNAAKLARINNAKIGEDYNKDPAIDSQALSKAAQHTIFYKKDDQGKWVLKNADEINPYENNYEKVLQSNPEAFYKGGGLSLAKVIKDQPVIPIDESRQWMDGYHKRTGTVKGNIIPTFQHRYEDPKTNHLSVQTNVENAPLYNPDGTPQYINGQPAQMPMLPKQDAESLLPTRSQKMAADIATRQVLKQHGIPENAIDPNSELFDQTRRHLLYNMVNPMANRLQHITKDDVPASVINKIYFPKQEQAQQDPSQIPSSFDKIRNIEVPTEGTLGMPGYNVKINNGNVIDKTGQPYSGNIQLPINEIPEELRHSVTKFSPNNNVTGFVKSVDKKGKIDHQQLGYIPVKVENGQITGIQTDEGTYFDRGDDLNSKMVENNQNSGKYKTPIYGQKRFSPAVKDNRQSKKKDPLGIF